MDAEMEEAQTLAESDYTEAPSSVNNESENQKTETKFCSSTQDQEERYRPYRETPNDEEKSIPYDPTGSKENVNVVDWEGPEDPHNPLNWTLLRKWTTISLVSAITFNVFVAPSSHNT